MKKNLKQISKFLSLILRHQPQKIDLYLDASGWAKTDELIRQSNAYGQLLDFETLREVVLLNDKQRFTFNDDFTKIRANQGHSINIDLGLTAQEPPSMLFHGTASRFVNNIRQKGLLKRNRQHVHLSSDLDTAKKVGQRHGVPVILSIDAGRMHLDGYAFYLSKNSVWLVDAVPIDYIQFP